ncbi:MAG TPA: hypothetical protein VMC83_10510 [Streptosporangiaceae bacterium]|nr:hypothetical protein [Streptosporangiaceae bacterium]
MGATLPDDHFRHSLHLLDNGGLPDAAADAEEVLQTLAQRYAYVFTSDYVLALLSELGPLIEIGAGTGYWVYRLRLLAVDIVAFDQAPPDGERANRYHARAETWSDVRQGDQTVLSGYPDRALFLCWPPLFSSLGDCLSHYGGRTIAYIGDCGYRTARLDHLQESFTEVAAVPVRALDPYPGVPASLTIWERTRQS